MHSSRMHSARLLEGGCLPQCVLGCPPGVGLVIPLGVGLETPSGVGLQTPWVWTWKPHLGVGLQTPPPDVGLETPPYRPPLARPLNFPLGCGPGDLQGMLGYHPLETCKAYWDTTCNACWDTPL